MSHYGDTAAAFAAECATLRARLRTVAQTLIAEVGATGPMDAEDAATRAVATVATLRAENATLRAEVARLREGLQTIATLTINFNNHSAVTMVRFASNVLAGRKHFDDGAALTPERT